MCSSDEERDPTDGDRHRRWRRLGSRIETLFLVECRQIERSERHREPFCADVAYCVHSVHSIRHIEHVPELVIVLIVTFRMIADAEERDHTDEMVRHSGSTDATLVQAAA